MSFAGVYVFVAGLVIAFASFLFAIVNMGRSMGKGLAGDPVGDFKDMFYGHLTAMAGMAVGGFVAVLGVVWFLVDLMAKYG